MTWIDLNMNNNYEILSEEPYSIRRKSDKYIISESKSNDGYISVSIKGRTFLKHRIIASQFISNPNNLPHVNHLNHNRDDNRIENLAWCSISDNLSDRSRFTKRKYEYIDSLTEHSIPITHYKTFDFPVDKYWYDEDNNRIISTFHKKYKIIKPSKNGGGVLIRLLDTNGLYHTVGYNKLIRTIRQSQ